MQRVMSKVCWCFVVAAFVFPLALQASELPTADEILKVHRENLSRLTHLHLRLIHEVEATEAESRRYQSQADGLEKIFGDSSLRKREIESLRSRKAFRSLTPMEFHLNGDDYQHRCPTPNLSQEEAKTYAFPEVPVTAETLLTTYRDVGIFSRSTKSMPPSRWWSNSVRSYAYIMQKHLPEVHSFDLPAYMSAIKNREFQRLPFDEFCSQPAEKYRVIRQEELNGRLLTVVDVDMPMVPNSNITTTFRGWLDLNRGAIPIQLYVNRHAREPVTGHFDRTRPYNVVVTNEVTDLPNGAFYPSRVLLEEWQDDPDAPRLTKEQLAEVRAGTRTIPKVVFRRYRWDCSLVEIKTDFADDFFNLPFPDGQTVFDHDARKVIGALETQPLVKIGQQAPPLTIGHWLDGKSRTLADFKGQVVVLEFWGLWCGSCRASVPELKALQEHFHNQPVNFVSIHTADGDPAVLSEKVKEFKASHQWNDVAAIDSGKMLEDSATTAAYGIESFPMMVIIGADGKITYVSSSPIGPDCDEEDPVILAKWEKTVNDFWKNRFDAVHEAWPVPENLTEKEQLVIYQKVERLFKFQQVELALKGVQVAKETKSQATE